MLTPLDPQPPRWLSSVMPLFTPAVAREMAAKALASKLRNKAMRLLNPPSQLPSPALVALVTALSPDDAYRLSRLACVRAHLDRLDKMLQTEKDPRDLDRLASATARLSEQERLLAGRPLPGAHRPDLQQVAKGKSAVKVSVSPTVPVPYIGESHPEPPVEHRPQLEENGQLARLTAPQLTGPGEPQPPQIDQPQPPEEPPLQSQGVLNNPV